MKSSEKQFLVKEKENEGMERTKAWMQIADLEKKEKVFKKLYHEKISLIKTLESKDSEIKKLKEQIFKLKFTLDSKEKSIPVKEVTKRGGIKLLKRLINFMEVGKEYTRTDLARQFIMTTGDIDECLEFLEEHKLMTLIHKEHKVLRI
jgi:predicted RNase H-like nuclease (RuvC/YqgF family)